MNKIEQAKLILPCENRLGEEPVWDSKTQTLYWVDTISPGKIFSYCPQSQYSQSWAFEHPVLALALHSAGGLLIAGSKTVWLWSPKTNTKVPYTTIEIDLPDNRINCMAVDPLGNLWVATMQNNVDDKGKLKDITGYFGSLYRVTSNGLPIKIVSDYACPNTMLWSPDGKYFYFGDSGTGWIYRYVCDLEMGQLSKREEFFRSDDNGIPDGSAIDKQGFLWNARWGGNCVLRISPVGELVQKLHLDALQPTCCVFGGINRNMLYITSARFGMETSQIRPNDGALFAYETEVGGRSTHVVKG
jgi:sugar lactone lactonase YvrE